MLVLVSLEHGGRAAILQLLLEIHLGNCDCRKEEENHTANSPAQDIMVF